MKKEGTKTILNEEEDEEFINLFFYIKDMKFGEIRIRVRHGKPYQISESRKDIMLDHRFRKHKRKNVFNT